MRPGRTGEIHSSSPAGSVRTWTFTPCRRCLAEQSARLSSKRSHSARVPSSRTKSGSCSRSVFKQVGGLFGEQSGHAGDVGVDGADGPVPGRDPGEGVVAAQVHQSDERALVRWELAAAVTLAGDDEHGDPLDQVVREVGCGRMGNQQGSCAGGLRRRTSLSTARELCASRFLPRPDRRHPISGHAETLSDVARASDTDVGPMRSIRVYGPDRSGTLGFFPRLEGHPGRQVCGTAPDHWCGVLASRRPPSRHCPAWHPPGRGRSPATARAARRRAGAPTAAH